MKVLMLTVASVLAVAASAQADINLTMTNAGNTNSSTVAAGSFFDIFVNIHIDGVALTSAQFQLQADAAADDLFTIQSAAFGSDWSTDPLDQFFTANQTLNAGNSRTSDLIGDIASDLVSGVGPGPVTSRLVSLHVLVSALAAPGDYTLGFIGDTLYGDPNFDTFSFDSVNDYKVKVTGSGAPSGVVPAPGGAFLAFVGVSLLAGRKRRLA